MLPRAVDNSIESNIKMMQELVGRPRWLLAIRVRRRSHPLYDAIEVVIDGDDYQWKGHSGTSGAYQVPQKESTDWGKLTSFLGIDVINRVMCERR
jgi:hypothetical protein